MDHNLIETGVGGQRCTVQNTTHGGRAGLGGERSESNMRQLRPDFSKKRVGVATFEGRLFGSLRLNGEVVAEKGGHRR